MKQRPQLKKLNNNTLIDKLVTILPPKLKKGVKFTYIKNDILFFVLTHSVYKMEFEYNKQDIKSLLKLVELDYIKDISFFVTNQVEKKIVKSENKKDDYKERSKGYFDNNSNDKKIRKHFEDIRKIIKDNKSSEN